MTSAWLVHMLVSIVLGAPVEYSKLSPFELVRWRDWTPEVRVAGEWYELVAVGDRSTESILVHCRKAHRGKAAKRFEEDLVQILSEMGSPPGSSVALKLKRLEGGEEVVVPAVPLSGANRDAIWSFRPNPRLPRIQRDHASGIPEALRHLTLRPNRGSDRPSPRLSTPQASEDLDRFEAFIVEALSYRTRRGERDQRTLDVVRAGLGDGIRADDFALQLGKVLARYGDGHTRVRGLSRCRLPGYLPFGTATADGGKVVAYRLVDGGQRVLLDPSRPYLSAIDGKPVEAWIEAASRLTAHGAPHFVRWHSVTDLAFLQHLRFELGIPRSSELKATLRSADGDTTTIELPVSDSPVFLRPESSSRCETLADDLGYLRLPSMTRRAARSIPEQMRELRDTAGLVVDVRGNGGGRRDALQALFPYFMDPSAAPHVANVAKYRTGSLFLPDHLAIRSLFRAGSEEFSEGERAAILELAASFRPEWAPPPGLFSEWHYFVLKREGTGVFHYDRPVVILQDSACFSATDIFLGAFAGRPGITLVGTPSGGGSGRSATYELPHSGIEFKLSTMASFRPDGRLYEGRGIDPDRFVGRTAGDVIGESDTQLDVALGMLKETIAKRSKSRR